jgi:hypothetical protein
VDRDVDVEIEVEREDNDDDDVEEKEDGAEEEEDGVEEDEEEEEEEVEWGAAVGDGIFEGVAVVIGLAAVGVPNNVPLDGKLIPAGKPGEMV